MTVALLLADLKARGVEVITDGRRIGVRPAGVLSDAEREALRRHKADVVALLTTPTDDRSPRSAPRPSVRWWSHPWPDDLPGLGHRNVGPFDLCSECGAWSWVRFGDRVLCLACARRRLHGR